MRLPGICTRCRKHRWVSVNAQEMLFAACGIKAVLEGVCAECEKEVK